jgi:hypothetical protein
MTGIIWVEGQERRKFFFNPGGQMEPDGQRKVVAVNGVFNLEANVAMRIIQGLFTRPISEHDFTIS